MSVGPFDFANLPAWMQVVLAVAAVAGAVVAVIMFVRRTWPVVVLFVQTVISLQNLPDFMDKTTETLAGQDRKIDAIHHEVQYNNGSSVKDAVDRIEIGVKGLYDRMDAAERELEQTRPRPPKPITPRKRTPKKE